MIRMQNEPPELSVETEQRGPQHQAPESQAPKRISHVVLCTPGFPISVDDPHKPFLLDHAFALAATGTKVTVVCPAHPDAPLKQTITQLSGAATAVDTAESKPAAIEPLAIEVVRVRFAPPTIARRIARGQSYRQFSGMAAVWVLPMLVGLGWTTARLARRVGAQVIHGHWWFPAGVAAVLATRFVNGARSVVHVHGTDLALARGPVSRWTARHTLRAAHITAAVSEQLANEIEGMRAGHSEVIPMPLPHSHLNVDGPLASGQLDLAPDDGPLLCVGRLVPEKGFDVLLEAIALSTSDRLKKAKVIIVGEGEQRASLTAQAEQLGVDLELVGEIAPTELAHYYNQARLVVVPSRREGFGLAIAQGLGASRAVVASDVGAASELIEPGVNGLLAISGDPISLADALAKAQSDWGVNGPASITHLSPATHADAMHAAYVCAPASRRLRRA